MENGNAGVGLDGGAIAALPFTQVIPLRAMTAYHSLYSTAVEKGTKRRAQTRTTSALASWSGEVGDGLEGEVLGGGGIGDFPPVYEGRFPSHIFRGPGEREREIPRIFSPAVLVPRYLALFPGAKGGSQFPVESDVSQAIVPAPLCVYTFLLVADQLVWYLR